MTKFHFTFQREPSRERFCQIYCTSGDSFVPKVYLSIHTHTHTHTHTGIRPEAMKSQTSQRETEENPAPGGQKHVFWYLHTGEGLHKIIGNTSRRRVWIKRPRARCTASDVFRVLLWRQHDTFNHSLSQSTMKNGWLNTPFFLLTHTTNTSQYFLVNY